MSGKNVKSGILGEDLATVFVERHPFVCFYQQIWPEFWCDYTMRLMLVSMYAYSCMSFFISIRIRYECCSHPILIDPVL